MDQITDYASLQAAVAGMLHRTGDSDIEDNAPLFIQMCEADLNDRLLLKDMEQEDTLACVVGQNYIALPSGFVSPIALWLLVSSVRIPLSPALPQQLPYDTSNSQPAYWAIDGANIRFDCPASDTYSVKFRYFKKSNLSNSNTSNALLLKRPDVYLYGALMQAALFATDEAGAAKWSGLFERAISGLKNAEHRSRSAVPLRGEMSSRRSNILTGD